MKLRAGAITSLFALITSSASAVTMSNYGVAQFTDQEKFAADVILSFNKERLEYAGNKNLYTDLLRESSGLPSTTDFQTFHVGTIRDEFNRDPVEAEEKYQFGTFILIGCRPEGLYYGDRTHKKQFLRCEAKHQQGKFIDVHYGRDWNEAVAKWYDKVDTFPFMCFSVAAHDTERSPYPDARSCIPLMELTEIYEPKLKARLLGGSYTGMSVYMDEILSTDPRTPDLMNNPRESWTQTRAVLHEMIDKVRKDKTLQEKIEASCRKKLEEANLETESCRIPKGI